MSACPVCNYCKKANCPVTISLKMLSVPYSLTTDLCTDDELAKDHVKFSSCLFESFVNKEMDLEDEEA